ncbi:MAG: hypothetical protein HOV87_19400 [Catenulispora sp.]|nr:hypothetical protein [Catenulispora sp.]
MTKDENENENEFEAAFRAMFAERSQDVTVGTAPYRAVRQRILTARRRRRQRVGSAGAALAVAAVGIGVWAVAGSSGPQSVGPAKPGNTSSPAMPTPQRSGPTRYYYDDGKTELPAGPLREAAAAYLEANYRGDLKGLSIVTTFDRAEQSAAEALKSPNDVGLAALDPKTGYVKVLRGPWDRPVQIADTMKPIVLAAAFETGHYTPDTVEPANADKHPVYWHDGDKMPLTYVDPQTHKARNWPPEHNDATVVGDLRISLRAATATAANAPFAYAGMASDVGVLKVLSTAVTLGIPRDAPDLQAVPSIVMGVSEASPLTMATVYGVFADGGVRHDPVLVSAVTDATGATVWKPDTTGKGVLSQNTATEITSVLNSVVTTGTASGRDDVRALGRLGMVGMPGTADNSHSAWFDGYSPDLVTSVALSRVDAGGTPRPLIGEPGGSPVSGSTVVAPLWAQFANQFAH